MKKKALFLDRDGTLNIDKGYVFKKEDFEFISGIPETLKQFKHKGYLLIVVTNQSGIARGFYKEEDVIKLHKWINEYLYKKYNFKIDAFYYCPHHPEAIDENYKQECNCRKPQAGMLLKAIKEYDIDLNKSYMIGDKDSDNVQLDGLKFIKVSEQSTLVNYLNIIK